MASDKEDGAATKTTSRTTLMSSATALADEDETDGMNGMNEEEEELHDASEDGLIDVVEDADCVVEDNET